VFEELGMLNQEKLRNLQDAWYFRGNGIEEVTVGLK
jgi:hypothetical protein